MNIALITARGGSKGLPRKNVLPLNGIPLIAWSIKAAKKANSIDEVYVSTDCQEIAKISEKYGAKIIIRPEALAQDDTSSEPVIEHAIEYLTKGNKQIDSICLLQPTSPLRSDKHIDEAYDLFIHNNAHCVISVFEPQYCIIKAYKVTEEGMLTGLISDSSPYSRRQDLPTAVLPNGAIYLFKSKIFIENNRIPRTNVFPFMMSEDASVDIDTHNDFLLAEEYLIKREINE